MLFQPAPSSRSAPTSRSRDLFAGLSAGSRNLSTLCIGMLFLNPSFSSPASTEYVKATVAALRKEIMEPLKSLQTEMNAIQQTLIQHKLGETFQGGRVFWLDKSQQHGLMVSLQDLTDRAGVTWHNGEGGDRIVNAQATGYQAGEANTRLIVAQQTIDQQDGPFAALLAANYQVTASGGHPCTVKARGTTCYSGWYLPSLQELLLLRAQLLVLDGKASLEGLYWSSSEVSTTEAWLVDFATGYALIQDKSTLARVRAVHTF